MSLVELVQRNYEASGTPLQDKIQNEAVYNDLIAQGVQIPSMNALGPSRIAPNSLVRFRGMVQDLFPPELYVGAYKDRRGAWRTTKYHDPLNVDVEEDYEHRLWERRPLLVVGIPGEAAWVGEALDGPAHAAQEPAGPAVEQQQQQPHRKRGREEEEGAVMGEEEEGREETPAAVAAPGGKRSLFDLPAPLAPPSTPGRAAKEDVTQRELKLPGSSDLACMVLLYPGPEGPAATFESLRAAEAIEVVGVMTVDPQLAALAFLENEGATSEDLIAEELAALPPTSRVPRLHAISVRRVDPMLGRQAPAAAELAAAAASLRPQALSVLSAALGGDGLAAEYLLLQLLARVYGRVGDLALGRHTLNLSGWPAAPRPSQEEEAQKRAGVTAENVSSFEAERARQGLAPSPMGQALASLLAQLAPWVAGLGLSLPSLNYCPWAPRKDHRRNRLVSGPLQLPPGCQLVLDETVLDSGKLGATGIANVHAAQRVAGAAVIAYDFEFSSVEMPADHPTTVVSTGKAMVQCDTQLRLAPEGPVMDGAAVAAALAAVDLGAVRHFLAAARAADMSDIDASLAERVQSDLVAARRADSALGEVDFHRWLTLSRLLALSHGEGAISWQRWQEVKGMEAARVARIKAAAPAGPAGGAAPQAQAQQAQAQQAATVPVGQA